jgi:hypothetical protein
VLDSSGRSLIDLVQTFLVFFVRDRILRNEAGSEDLELDLGEQLRPARLRLCGHRDYGSRCCCGRNGFKVLGG